MSKDYISQAIAKLIDRKISQVSQEAKYAYKGKLLEDMLIPDSDTFTAVTLDTDYDLDLSVGHGHDGTTHH